MTCVLSASQILTDLLTLCTLPGYSNRRRWEDITHENGVTHLVFQMSSPPVPVDVYWWSDFITQTTLFTTNNNLPLWFPFFTLILAGCQRLSGVRWPVVTCYSPLCWRKSHIHADFSPSLLSQKIKLYFDRNTLLVKSFRPLPFYLKWYKGNQRWPKTLGEITRENFTW